MTLLDIDFETTLPTPIQILLRTVIGFAISIPALPCSGSMTCSAVVKQQFEAIKTLSPNETFASSIMIRLWFA